MWSVERWIRREEKPGNEKRFSGDGWRSKRFSLLALIPRILLLLHYALERIIEIPFLPVWFQPRSCIKSSAERFKRAKISPYKACRYLIAILRYNKSIGCWVTHFLAVIRFGCIFEGGQESFVLGDRESPWLLQNNLERWNISCHQAVRVCVCPFGISLKLM